MSRIESNRVYFFDNYFEQQIAELRFLSRRDVNKCLQEDAPVNNLQDEFGVEHRFGDFDEAFPFFSFKAVL